MSKTLFLEPSWLGTGFTNEIFFIVYGIIDCINNKRKNLVINNFRLEPMTNKFCGISEILDIHHLNILLNEYDISVFDRNKLSFNMDSIIYGINDATIDITKETLNFFYKDRRLCIPVGTTLNNIKGDPTVGETKKLYITYTINGNKVVEEYFEFINEDIIIDLQNPKSVLNWDQIDNCYVNNKELFDYLLKNIKFNNRFVKYSEIALLIDRNNDYTNISNIDFQNKKTNVIHLRVEKDMTGHMLSHNKMTQEEYDIELQNKYIKLIKQYFSKNDIIFLLSYDLNNNIINYLKDNDYEFYITKKQIFEGREQHAIVDLLIGEKCNNCFIGNWNFDIRQGSTFSYFLYVRNNALENIFIDMYDIREKEIISNNVTINKNIKFVADSSIDGEGTIKYILNNNIEGVLVECGIDSGKFEEIWINELMKNNEERDIYMYDTFCGLTEPGENDYTCKDAILYKMTKDDVHKTWETHIINDNVNNWCYTPLESVKNKLNSKGYPENKLHYIVGDVMETLKNKSNIPEKIAVLRLDTDWYESSKYELEQMYDNVVCGGVIIFDDYYHWEGQRKATDDFFKKINMNYHFININNGKTAAIIKKNNINLKITNNKTLKDLIDNTNTDKNTTHSYLDLYQELLSSKKYTAKNILEIGIGDFKEKNGGSVKLWYEYFINADIYSMDILGPERVLDEIKNNNRIKLYTETDGYDEYFFKKTFLDKNIKFDMMLDDGPHSLETMKQFIKLYSQIMAEDGILMIEDVASIDWIDELKSVVPENLKKYIQWYDLRANKGRYDDIVFVINKNKDNSIDNYEYILSKYKTLCNTYLDINEHLPTLYNYAKECNSILECGVRGCVSSWAFAYGLIDNKNDIQKKLILNDIDVCNIDDLLNNTKCIKNLKIDYKWCSDLDLNIDENVDLVFIDTLHVYGQLKRELDKFSKVSNKYIIMHDTTIDEIYGEPIRLNLNIENMSKITNYTHDELTKGLKFAIDEFLLDNKDWIIHEIFINNNGLTVLKKIENHKQKLLPISFSIPEEKICKNIDISVKTKIEAFVKPLNDRSQSYKYDKEEDYYNDLRTSFFAHTCKRNGWDTMRHYEILANNCIPYFSDLNECPKNILCFFPKELIKVSNKLYESIKNIEFDEFLKNNEYINTYTDLLIKLKNHTNQYLTTRSLANYIINSSQNRPKNILFLSPNQKVDYLKELTLHGLKTLFGNKCHDYPKTHSIYKSCVSNDLYGNGFTYSKLLDDNYRDDTLDNTIEDDIVSKKYDMIIYSQTSIYYKFYDIISKVYEPSQVIFLNGEDHVTHFHLKDYNNKISKGHFCYIREFHNFNNYDYFIPFINYFAGF